MEVDDIQNQTQTPQHPCKYSRVNSNGRIGSSKIALGGAGGGGGGGGGGATNGETHDSEVVGPTTTALATTTPATRAMTGGGGGGVGGGFLGGEMVVGSNGTNSRFGRQWQHSSRIIRVSRASGGKDRHSKVWTAKGPRDRRVRLSVTTAIQFYDLQDRLGYDQPSKAVEWLIKAASEAINELPSLNTASFPPETPRQLSDERKSGGGVNNGVVDDSGNLELLDGEVDLGQNHQQQMGSKSGCSSNNSETSKGSGLSLSRSEIRVKARERARERTAKEKERDGEPSSMVNVVASHQRNNQQQQHQQNVSSMAHTSSFTQLLTAGMTNLNENNSCGGASSSPSAEMGLSHKQLRASGGGSNNNNNNTANNNQWLSSATSTTQMADYFGNGLMGLSSSRVGHIGIGSNTSSLPQVMTIASFGGGSDNHHQSHHDQLQHHQHHNPHHHHTQQRHFPFMSDQHLIQVANAASGAIGGGGGGGGGNEYNLNFSMSSTSTTSSALAAAGYNNRGTLQSNSPSLLPYFQRFSAATEGSSLPFFLGSAAVSSASPNVENHHHQQHHHQQQHFQPPGLQLCYGDGGRQTDQKGKGNN